MRFALLNRTMVCCYGNNLAARVTNWLLVLRSTEELTLWEIRATTDWVLRFSSGWEEVILDHTLEH